MTSPTSLLPFPHLRVFSQVFVGFSSGFAGSIVLGIILFFSWSIVGGTLSDISENKTTEELALDALEIDESPAHPLFLSVVMMSVFLSALIANVTHVLLSTTIRGETEIRSTALTHVFIGNLVIGLLMLLVYILGNIMFGPTGVSILGIFHWTISVLFSVLSFEILRRSRYALVDLYGVVLGLCVFAGIASLMGITNIALVAFLTLPLLMACLGLGNGWAKYFYNAIFQSYGTDFLNVQTRFGDDYGQKDAPLEQVQEVEI